MFTKLIWMALQAVAAAVDPDMSKKFVARPTRAAASGIASPRGLPKKAQKINRKVARTPKAPAAGPKNVRVAPKKTVAQQIELQRESLPKA